MSEKELFELALEARKKAYAPYSSYQVGAALICEDGSLYTGCNIENASYGATNCAERTAVFKAVSEGHRKIKMIAIAGGSGEKTNFAYPCGVCRQVMREFSEPAELIIVVGDGRGELRVHTLEELLPESFGPDFME
ncbi:MAG: cytidine deaminase [Lachnospiraceae bacterium]|nr:cytidine deaminase [Lachnospiraceae bacterium]